MTAACPAGAVSRRMTDWHAIPWRKVYRVVRRLQARIVQAVQAGRSGKAKALQRLLARSFSARALAVRRVTEATGRRTPGVDGETWDTPASRAAWPFVSGLHTVVWKEFDRMPLRGGDPA